MARRIELLDHGYLELVEHWGSDERIIEAARMSTGKGFLGWGPTWSDEPCDTCGGKGEIPQPSTGFNPSGVPVRCLDCLRNPGKKLKPGDEKLLRYLWTNKHATPFEMAGLIVEVQAPIFVFREWHRHRTQSFNEMSARYMPVPDVNYVPTVERLMIGGGHLTKQAGTIQGASSLTARAATRYREELSIHYERCETLYQSALTDGVPKELARVHLPVGRYSRMRASANLRNWMHFLTLRMAPQAQHEIRQYATAVGELVRELYPRTWALFAEGLDDG